ncbi:MAG: N-acetylmuramoyl-L-alanine amidase [Chitinophagaceae bacterium]|nr:N-acetylmuramoyl-L-alanine amidase [Chitinophagaceae bacterium]
MKHRLAFIISAAIILYGCSQSKYAATNKSYKKQVKNYAKILAEYPLKDSAGMPYADDWVGTTNLSMRRANYVIIHHTAQNSCEQTLQTFTLPRTQVSAHYVICRDGTVHHMLNDLLRAHHAGVSKWGNTTDLNSSSIGIELDNNGFESFSEAQMNSLLQLLDRLKKAYSIPASNFIGHGDIAPTRKNDPNWRFPWKLLSDKGFGNWYEDAANITLPDNFNHLQALRIVGYDIKDTNAAIVGFKRHWLQDTTRGLNTEQLKVLYQLSKKYQ